MKIILIALLFGFCAKANADHYYRNITITGAGIYGSGGKSILFVDFVGSKAEMTACATSRRLAIDSNAPQFKEMVAIALMAYAKADTKVDILVNDSCNYWGNVEDIVGIKMGGMPW